MPRFPAELHPVCVSEVTIALADLLGHLMEGARKSAELYFLVRMKWRIYSVGHEVLESDNMNPNFPWRLFPCFQNLNLKPFILFL